MVYSKTIELIKYNRLELKCITAQDLYRKSSTYRVQFYLTALYSPHWCLGENMSYLKMETVQEKATWVHWFFETKSVIKMQHRYRTQHGKDSPSDNAIRHWRKYVISRDWEYSAPKMSGKTEHFAGRCWSNPRSLDILRATKGVNVEVF
jgi:hypothetical protein